MKLKTLIFIILVFMFNIFSNAQDKTTEMTIDEMIQGMKKNPDQVILDVRTAEELNGPLGHIPGIIHIPVQELNSRMKELEKYKDKDIAVICRTGNRSGFATKVLRQNGYNARNVLGGMVEYKSSKK